MTDPKAMREDLVSRLRAYDGSAQGVRALLDEAAGEIERLNRWADGFTDRHLEERRTGEEYQREQRAEIKRLGWEVQAKDAEWKLQEQLKNEALAEIGRLRASESRLDASICWHLPIDPDGPGDCTDRLVAAIDLAGQRLAKRRGALLLLGNGYKYLTEVATIAFEALDVAGAALGVQSMSILRIGCHCQNLR